MALSDCPKCWDTPCTCVDKGCGCQAVISALEAQIKKKDERIKVLVWAGKTLVAALDRMITHSPN